MNNIIEDLITESASDYRRRREPNWTGIIIHHTGQSNPEDKHAFLNIVNWLIKKDKHYVSSHYVIGHQGELAQLVDPDKYEAFHAGKSRYWHPAKRRVLDDWNRYAIGIELVGNGNEQVYSKAQYKTLTRLTKQLMLKYPSIHPLAIVGHENISPGRKVDPGAGFDWLQYFKYIYG
jgi:N-acetyl-anhydromuramyl-L-alanine amidase AmpD